MVARPQPPLASVVIPVRDGATTLERCLTALNQQTVPRDRYEVIVVDDGSIDDSAVLAERLGAHVLQQEGQGPAAARNAGARIAQGEFLLFTDADCVPRETWVECMLAGFTTDDVVGVKGAYHADSPNLWSRFAQVEFEERYALLRAHDSIDMVDTHAAGFRKEVFEKAGGFDPSFPVADNEDTELSYRLAEGGATLRFAPEARVLHLGHPSSTSRYARLKFRRGFWRSVVYRLFPGKAVRDTYTPQLLKFQTLAALLLPAALVGAALGWVAASLITWSVLWLALCAPFTRHAWSHDRTVALLAPAFLWVRGAALGVGAVCSLLSPTARRIAREATVRERPRHQVQMLFSLGFMESRVYKVAQALRDESWNVHLLCWDREEAWPAQETQDGIEIERIQFRGGVNAGPGFAQKLKFFRFYAAVWRSGRTKQCDVIHCVNLDTLILGSLLGLLHRKPVVYDAHEPNYYAYWSWTHAPLRAALRFLEKHLSRRAGLVIVTSDFQRKKYEAFGAKIVHLPNYAEKRLMKDVHALTMTKPKRAFTFGRIGSMYDDTGVRELIEAFRRVSRTRPHVRLRLAGRIHPPYVPVLDQLIDDELKSRVDVSGGYEYDELPTLYQGIDVSILPYRQSDWFKEISPVKFFESMSYGVPVVASDIGGIGRVVQGRDLGYVLDEGTVEELVEIMSRLADDPEPLREMGRRAHRAMVEEFNWEGAIRRLGDPYASAARGRPTPTPTTHPEDS